jgi:hypothetical protein
LDKLPLYHERAQGGIPKWWFAAPVVAFAYTLMTPRVLPDVVTAPEPLANVTRWLVGLVLGVIAIVAVRLVQWVRTLRRGAL